MSWPTRAALVVAGVCALAATIFFLMWKEAEARATAENVQYELLKTKWEQALIKHDALRSSNGKLITERDKWMVRAERDPDVITKHIFEKLPADCRQCVLNYKLDRSYTNPAQDQIPPQVINIAVTDVLGANQATWDVDLPKLCPVALCPLPGRVSCPDTGVGSFLLAEAGLGYGVAGPEVGAGIYPLAIRSPKWELAVGGWGHLTLHDTGTVNGNAVIGVKAYRKAKW